MRLGSEKSDVRGSKGCFDNLGGDHLFFNTMMSAEVVDGLATVRYKSPL